jgi:hypothetical protein
LLAVGLDHLPLHLAIGAKLLPVNPTSLRLLDALAAKLLTVNASLRLLNALRANLLTIDASLRLLNALRANLLTFDSGGTFGAHLDAFGTSRTSLAFGAHLNALGTSGPVHRCKALAPLHARRGHLLHALHSRRCHLLHARRALGAHLHPISTRCRAIDALRALRCCTAFAAAMRPRLRRGCNRQCGDSRGEKYPGHHTFSFSTAKRPIGRTVPARKRMEHAI